MKRFQVGLGLCLSFSFAGYAQQSEIVRIKIPVQYSKLYSEELIKRLVILPELDRTAYIFAADTTLTTLEVCGGNGVYYFGQGPTDHTSARYRVAIKVGDELQYARDGKSQLEHKQLVNNYYAKTLNSDKCVTYDTSVSLNTQVIKLIKLNNRKTSSDKF
ncbi:hypothetical protein [Hymenobacter wooponensis]|uniref:Uncharacterized protein n=1 Tax=Hymenobacter wooponensis TaxID=1525360 RepID=A0A4Z0MGC6_9BACT|nr:hypothetical protein [Hymenobacter wooponensis]TGD78410.1 hypothetical protein EU557_20095 [Hymenobacter wooponensis]